MEFPLLHIKLCSQGKVEKSSGSIGGGMSKIFDPLMHGGNKKVRHT